MKDDAIAQLLDQLVALTTRMQEIEGDSNHMNSKKEFQTGGKKKVE
jgi:hypothetical protein